MNEPKPSDIDDQAALWVARMDGDDWSGLCEFELQEWLRADPRHGGALLQAQAIWMMVDTPGQSEAAEPKRESLSRRALLATVGSAAVAGLGAAIFWSMQGSLYETQIGEVRRVPLRDGSVAEINTGTDLQFRMGSTRREVTLSRGEAWFHVAKDRKRPFIVESGHARVQAVGTAFSVHRTRDGAEVMVTEGTVEVWTAGAAGDRTLLTAGQRTFVHDAHGIGARKTAPSEIERALAWRSGLIDLDGDTLEHAVAEFNRYNTRKLILTNPEIGREQFDGVFRFDDPEGFAQAIRRSLNVEVDETRADQITIGDTNKIPAT